MNLNNKGFTLIEILAVVVIIGIVGGITTVGVLSAINNSKNTSNRVMIDDIITASQVLYEEVNYVQTGDNKLYIYDQSGRTINPIMVVNQKIEINLQTLVSNGFLNGTENNCKNNAVDEENEDSSDDGAGDESGGEDIEFDESTDVGSDEPSTDDTEASNTCNANKRIIRDPKTKEDIGMCKIRISYVNNDYKVEAINDPEVKANCPTVYERTSK